MIMINDPDYIYIFLHIPKCAGTTFSEHLKCNFKSGSLLSIGPSLRRKFRKKTEVDEYISSLSQSHREKIKVVVGHSVYYGIHEHFQRPARYITFLRNPVSQVISLYNYFIEHYDFLIKGDYKGRFPKDKGQLPFGKWLELFEINLQIPTVLNYKINGRIGVHGDTEINGKHLEEAKHVLDQFYFVGLTETFEEDSLFLYHETEIKKFIREPQNVTTKKHIHQDAELLDLISRNVTLDQQLYDHAVMLNSNFKKSHAGFNKIVQSTKDRRIFVKPFKLILAEKVMSVFGVGAVARLQSLKSRVRELKN